MKGGGTPGLIMPEQLHLPVLGCRPLLRRHPVAVGFRADVVAAGLVVVLIGAFVFLKSQKSTPAPEAPAAAPSQGSAYPTQQASAPATGLQADWVMNTDPATGRNYWLNPSTGESRWEMNEAAPGQEYQVRSYPGRDTTHDALPTGERSSWGEEV